VVKVKAVVKPQHLWTQLHAELLLLQFNLLQLQL
jgi:hypothetical protein